MKTFIGKKKQRPICKKSEFSAKTATTETPPPVLSETKDSIENTKPKIAIVEESKIVEIDIRPPPLINESAKRGEEIRRQPSVLKVISKPSTMLDF